MSREQKLYSEVEKHLGMKVPANVWRYLKQKHYVEEAIRRVGIEDPIVFLANEAQMILDFLKEDSSIPPAVKQRNRRIRREKNLPTRNEMMSFILAGIAENDGRVRSYRERFLASGLVDEAAAPKWIEEKLGLERYSHAIIVALPKTVEVELDYESAEYKLPISGFSDVKIEGDAPAVLLEYKKPDCNWVQRIPTGRDGVLRELAALSEALAADFGWQKAPATMFVLTGDVPTFSPNGIAVHSPPFPGPRARAWLSRLVITVDPLLSPAEVATMYRKARTKLLKPGNKSLSEKHMTLAGFAAAFGGVSRELMGKWNIRYPKWEYPRYSLFSRDARTSTERLLGSSVLQSFSFRRYLADTPE